MTAEVAVMNKHAVALAADSAVTIGSGVKILSSNKLFTLSKYRPVGIMIYGDAEFMGMPWETLVKAYRLQLGTKCWDTLQEYADDFVRFLDSAEPICSEEIEKRHVEHLVYRCFHGIQESIKEEWRNAQIKAGQGLEEAEAVQVASDVIKSTFQKWEEQEVVPSAPEGYVESTIARHREVIDQAIARMFGKLPFGDEVTDQLRVIAGSLFGKKGFPVGSSGIVIAGFGERDVFPSLIERTMQGRVNSVVKYEEVRNLEVCLGREAGIVPFAQSEMVYEFMEGIDPRQQDVIEAYVAELFRRYSEAIAEAGKALGAEAARALRSALEQTSGTLVDDFQATMKRYRLEKQSDPIVQMVAALPKDQLADMAEALVSLTSFKRRVTPEAETVGGAIDVAVVSKGDGFIWIKRKHYFKGDLNPQFFANYFREA